MDSEPTQNQTKNDAAELPPAFVRLAWSNLSAQAAEQISLAAVPLVAVLKLNAAAGEIGFLATIQTLPFLLLSIPLGLLADRMSRRKLMVAAECLRAGSLLGLLLATFFNQLSLPLLAVLGFVGAVGTVGFSVAAPSLVPALVAGELLGRANGRLELARSIAFAAGPALAGALVSWAGASSAFVLATVLSVLAVVLLFRLREPTRASQPPKHPLLDLKEGARMVWTHKLLRPILLTAIAWNIAWFVMQAAYIPYAIRTMGMSAEVVGVTLATYGAGMIFGSLLAQWVIKAVPFGVAVMIGPAFSVFASIIMFATLWFAHPILAAVSFFLFGAGPIIWTITSTTLRQTVTPGAMLGRVSAIFLTVNAGARPLGAALGGLIGAHWGEAACLAVSLLGFCAQAALIVFSTIRTLQTLPPAADSGLGNSR
jgi:predicted MFS family arabinose efflux permease